VVRAKPNRTRRTAKHGRNDAAIQATALRYSKARSTYRGLPARDARQGTAARRKTMSVDGMDRKSPHRAAPRRQAPRDQARHHGDHP
jgi:hypothetical protein